MALEGPISRPAEIAVRSLVAAVLALIAAAAFAADIDHIAIDDYRLQISCEGFGTPTVVMDSGLGGSSLEWVFVSQRLREITKVCTYDRAGYGASDMGPMPRTSSRIANELFLLLNEASVASPFILVGHSFGGYNMQLFARRYPYLSAGLVLIDASHPDQVERFLAPPLNMITAPSSRHGIVQFRDPPPPHVQLPDNLKRKVVQLAGHWKTRRTLASELLSFRDSARQLKSSEPLHDLPLIVITRGKIEGEHSPRRLQIEKVWLELQSDLARSSDASAHLVAGISGHHVHIEQPDLVAFAIALLVDRQRAGDGDGEAAAHFESMAHDRFKLNDAAWLKDNLDLHPDQVALIANAHMCTDTWGDDCGSGEDGAP
jgi:pimeloyl-ACP methyl ester carboxylesterase